MTRKVPLPNPEVAKLPCPDLSFRPETYWPEDSLRLALLGNVQGEMRRRLILEALELGDAEIPPEGLLQPVLQPDLRDFLGKIHPMLMGGEHLPDYLPTEVEIARVFMRSTTGDVISVRARLEGDDLIHYRIVDEYQDDPDWPPYTLAIPISETSLTLGEIIRQLEESSFGSDPNIVLGPIARNLNEGSEAEYMRGFITVSSNFYPTLGEMFGKSCEAHLDSVCQEEDDDEE